MMTLIENIKSRAYKAAQYRQTVHELKNLGRHEALDLEIFDCDIPSLARKSVYGV